MAYSNNKLNLEKMLLKFLADEDPMLSMLKWLCEQLMEVEVTAKINASKSERNSHVQDTAPAIEFDVLIHVWEPCTFLSLKSAKVVMSLSSSLKKSDLKWH
jgi:hypothetical protein